MSMIKSLRFVQGGIGTSKAGIPDMEHYRIKDNRITAFNGRLALSAPFGMNIVAYPRAAEFVKAIRACADASEVRVKLTDGGKLGITTGSFRAYINSLPDVDYHPEPVGKLASCPDTLLDDLAKLAPFVSEDASRGWSMGVLFEAGCITATNNVAIVRLWNAHGMPPINLPGFAVKELLRIGEAPTMLQSDQHSITFHYIDGSWLKTSLIDEAWPSAMVDKILNAEASLQPVPEALPGAVETIAAFADSPADPIYFENGYISSSPHQQDGAMVAVPGLRGGPCFNVKSLRLVMAVAEKIDFSGCPDRPCIFEAQRLRGAVVGRNR